MDIEKWSPILNALTYGILQSRYTTAHVDAAITHIVDEGGFSVTTTEYLDAVRAALAYQGDLAELLDTDHGDENVRSFLRAIEGRLASRLGI